MLLTLAGAANAATLEVTTTGDELGAGPGCSLREALKAANDNAAFGGCPAGTVETDTLLLGPGVHALTQGQLIVSGGSVRIVGAGQASTSVVGSGGHRLLWISGATAEIEGISFRGGEVADDGGAILATGSNVTLRDCSLAESTAMFGGGYCQFSSNAELIGVTIEDNVATAHGGGVFNNNGILSIEGGTVRGNVAESNAGGGIYNSAGSSLTLTGVAIVENEASQSGGGLHNLGNLAASDATLALNRAPFGAGMRNQSLAVATLTGATIEENEAVSHGGGVHDAARLTIEASTVRANRSGGCGGGVHAAGSLTVAGGSVFEENEATSGGGICVQAGSFAASDTELRANTASADGGGLYARAGSTLERVTVSHNAAARGAGIALTAEAAPVRLANLTVSANAASGDGGGVLAAGELLAVNATIFANTAGSAGGGIALEATADARVASSIVARNTSASGADCSGSLQSLGHNVLGDLDGCDVTGESASDLVGAEPALAPLARVGGLVRTHALLAGSPAVDAGSPDAPSSGDGACEPTDARGVERPADGDGDETAVCDAGAFEGAGGVQGDATCDGAVSSADALGVLRDSVGLTGAACIERGDVSCDGERSASDALAILGHSVGLATAALDDCSSIGALL